MPCGLRHSAALTTAQAMLRLASCCGSLCLSACLAVPLAAGRSQHYFGGGDFAPVGLVQILAEVVCGWMVYRVVLHCKLPVVGRPDYFHASHGRTGAESAGAGEKVNCSHRAPESKKPAQWRAVIGG